MGAFTSEWLVTDPRGAFAMGTLDGIRTRKYHGFYMGIPGRSETAFLVDLEIECEGRQLWPHLYGSPQGTVLFPNPDETGMQLVHPEGLKNGVGPAWQWAISGGKLKFHLEPRKPGGIALIWSWESKSRKSISIKVRSLWGMRNLHDLEGKPWVWVDRQELEGEGRIEIKNQEGRSAHCLLQGDWKWIEDPCWYQNFHYTEEVERGYPADENLFSAGWTEINLTTKQSFQWVIAEDPSDLDFIVHSKESSEKKKKATSSGRGTLSRVSDFVLTQPAGVIAGYPWFGEWGRDTFVSLPGIVAELLKTEKNSERIWDWVREVLYRWGNWIDEAGMLPNVLEKDGQCQWQSADATLWWCHSLAALWSFFPLAGLQVEFEPLLAKAIYSIKNNQHQFLRMNSDQLLEVTEPHATWMDARIAGKAVTPRQGLLPEMNALWFQALCLHFLWSGFGRAEELSILGKKVLQCKEPDRPNTIFFHSIPLAPSFVLNDENSLEQDLWHIAENFWTPVGLRTLAPSHPDFHKHCVGSQEQRDRAYHQGLVWGWLGGHFEMARHRLISKIEKLNTGPGRAEQFFDKLRFDHTRFDKMFTIGLLKDMPIEGHIPEIFDADIPFTPRGAPAQAWSLACWEESKARRRIKADLKISKVLAQRWLERRDRKPRSKRQGQEGVNL